MESCFKCRTTFRNPKEYHHPRDCPKLKQTGLKKRPNFNPETSTSSSLQRSKQWKNTAAVQTVATAWTPSQGGVIQNKRTGEWELLGPLQKKLTVKTAEFNIESDQLDYDHEDDTSQRNI